MAEVQPEVLSDILMWNALDKTRAETATRVNEEHSTDLSGRDVGEHINRIEAEAEAGDAKSVYYRVHGRGVGVNIGEDLASIFAAE